MSFLTENIIPAFLQDPKNWPERELGKKAEKIHEHLEVHAEGKWSPEVMDCVRPNEEESVTQHRKEVFKSPVKPYFQKAVKHFGKVRDAQDWEVRFSDASVIEAYFKDYCTKNFPYDDSVENYVFNVMLKEKFEDPNAVLLVAPKTKPSSETEYYKPYCWIYESDQVIFAADNEYYVLEEEEKSEIKYAGSTRKEGKILKFVSRDEILVYRQIGKKEDWKFLLDEEKSYIHNFGFIPAFKLGGDPCETNEYERIYDSVLSPALDMFDEACRRYSDEQANWILHMNPERWEIQDSECPTCNGTKVEQFPSRRGGEHSEVVCRTCHGNGHVSTRSPYNVKLVKPASQTGLNNVTPIPTPPIGYVSRDTKLIELQDKEVDKKIYQGLSCLNLEYLMQSPLATSGVSKAYDRSESQSLILTVMNDLIDNNMKPIYYFISKWLFSSVLTEDKITELVPFINKAKKLDYINNGILADRVEMASKAGFSTSIVSSLQLQYAKYDLGEDSNEYLFLKNIYELNPYASKTSDEKLVMSSMGTADNDMLILSDNVDLFVTRAWNEDNDFYSKSYFEKMAIMNKYVQEVKGKAIQQIIPIQ